MLLTMRQRTLPRAALMTGDADVPGPYSHGYSGYPPPASWAAGGMGGTLQPNGLGTALMGATYAADPGPPGWMGATFRPTGVPGPAVMGRTRNAAIRYGAMLYGDEHDPNMGRTRNAGDAAPAGDGPSPWVFGLAGLALGAVAGYLIAGELRK